MNKVDEMYRLSPKDNIVSILQGILLAIILGILFYRSILGVIILSPIIYFYHDSVKKQMAVKRKWKLNLEFKDGLLALSAALEAGYSAEHAFEEACKDLHQLYPENSIIIKEFTYILRQVQMNITVERALNDFGERTGIEDIISFAEVFQTAKRTGGDLINVIKISGNIIGDKIEVKRDIVTLITGKRLEANLMKFIPLGILVYLSITSPNFLDPLYHNLYGIIIMSALLVCYLGAFILIDKIVAIEI